LEEFSVIVGTELVLLDQHSMRDLVTLSLAEVLWCILLQWVDTIGWY